MLRVHAAWFAVVTTSCIVACGNDSSKDASKGGPNSSPVVLESSEYSYRLSEGTTALPMFTTPATHRLTEGDVAPSETRSGLHLSAARREFEPVQLVLGPGDSRVQITSRPFPRLGVSQRLNLAVGQFEDGIIDRLDPIAAGARVTLNSNVGTAIWLTVFVPPDAPAGDHATTLELSLDDGPVIEVPIQLHVFDFVLPAQAHFGTQINVGISGLVPEGGQVDDAKNLLFEHRMTPTSVTWPSGFGWNITWDNGSAPARCHSFWDEPTEDSRYSIGALAKRYVLGEGWNGIGFSDSEFFQFVDNATPRPATFCGVARGDHHGTADYNAAWSAWLTALDGYLVEHGYAERGYYYVQNEPQNDVDHELANYLCRLTKAAAPHLRIAISEEPKPEIAEHANGPCGYNLWIAHVRAYGETYAWKRQAQFGETVWFYSLDHDPDPYFNPTIRANQGMHERIIPWAAWSHRIRGWAYYDGGRFFDGSHANTRAELLREGFEDYEYLWLANGSAHPEVGQAHAVDATVKSVAASMTSWTRNADALMKMRDGLGRYLGGETSTLPTLAVASRRPRGAYYINFQNPVGAPTSDPLIVDGNPYIKVGWEPYDARLGYGWSGENVGNPAIALYGFDAVDGFSTLQQSYIYDDYGRDNLFEFDLAAGRYRVAVGVGRPKQGYPNDPYNVVLEGVRVVDDEVATNEASVLERSTVIDITDGSLSVVTGGRSARTGDYAYTFLAYLTIVPID